MQENAFDRWSVIATNAAVAAAVGATDFDPKLWFVPFLTLVGFSSIAIGRDFRLAPSERGHSRKIGLAGTLLMWTPVLLGGSTETPWVTTIFDVSVYLGLALLLYWAFSPLIYRRSNPAR